MYVRTRKGACGEDNVTARMQKLCLRVDWMHLSTFYTWPFSCTAAALNYILHQNALCHISTLYQGASTRTYRLVKVKLSPGTSENMWTIILSLRGDVPCRGRKRKNAYSFTTTALFYASVACRTQQHTVHSSCTEIREKESSVRVLYYNVPTLHTSRPTHKYHATTVHVNLHFTYYITLQYVQYCRLFRQASNIHITTELLQQTHTNPLTNIPRHKVRLPLRIARLCRKYIYSM